MTHPVRSFGVAAAALLAVSLTGTAAAEPVVLHRGNTGEVTTLDPHQAVSHHEAHVLRDL